MYIVYFQSSQSSHNMSDLSQRSDDTGVGLGREGGAVRRGGEGGIVIIEPSENRKKGLFRRHAKTPSSPARLVTSVSNQSDWEMNGSHMTSMDRAEESISDSQLDHTSSRHHQRGYSGDTSLRRGRPNTIKSGLPSPRHKRLSVEQDALKRGGSTFVSPVKCEMFDCGPDAFDTSPIASIAQDMVTSEDCLPPEGSTMSDTPLVDTEQHVNNVTMEIDESSSNVDQLPLDHDNAFIQDSILCAETAPVMALEITCLETTPDMNHAETAPEEIHDEMDGAMEHAEMALTTDSVESSAPGDDTLSASPEENSLDNAVSSGHDDTCDSRFTTAETSHTHSTTDHVGLRPSEGADSSETTSTLHVQLSDGSLDSAVCLSSDTASVDSVTCLSSDTASIDSHVIDASLNAPLAGDSRDKSQSTASVKSCDSGIGLGGVQPGHVKPCSPQGGDSVQSVVWSVRPDVQCQQDLSTEKDTMTQQLFHNNEYSAKIERDDTGTKSGSPNRCRAESGDRYWSPLRFPNSPLRRPRRGASPVRIPTIFAKADQEASRYRELAKSVLRTGPSPRHSRQPSLPISTNLLRLHTIESARCRLAEGSTGGGKLVPRTDTLAGHTPLRVSRHIVEHQNTADEYSLRIPLRMSDSLNREECASSKILNTDELTTMTPRIKPPLLAGNKRLLTPGESLVTPHRRCHSPVKPVKRLQGSSSPSSPRRYGRSPRRCKNSPVKHTPAYSPGAPSILPAHVTDWNV